MRAADAPIHLRRLRAPRPLGTLLSLFLLARDVDANDAAAALPLDAAEAEGFVERDGAIVRPLVQITPFGELLLVHDREDASEGRADYVAGIGPATRTLAALTVRRQVESAVDIGTGCGVQALLASRHAERVVGIDINPRAIRFARLSAELNGIDNVEWREGSFYEPVRDERFDLVVANPPFVISFDSEYVYRDTGEAGDAISRDVVRGAAAQLGDDGYATILCSWVHEPAGVWEAPLRGWLEGTGCDAWLLHYESDDPLAYAARWNEGLRGRDPTAFVAALDRWLAHYRRHGIEAVATGAVMLRRTGGPSHVRADEMPLGPSGSASDQILRVFAAQSRLAELATDDALLDTVPALVDGHRLEQSLVYRGAAYTARPARLVLQEGAGVAAAVEAEALHVVFRIDGVRPLRELVAEAIDDTGLDPDRVSAATVAAVRSLFALGFVVFRHYV